MAHIYIYSKLCLWDKHLQQIHILMLVNDSNHASLNKSKNFKYALQMMNILTENTGLLRKD